MLDETVNLEWVDGDPEVGQKRGSRRSECAQPSVALHFLQAHFGTGIVSEHAVIRPK